MPAKVDRVFIERAEFATTDFEHIADRRLRHDDENVLPTSKIQLHRIKAGEGTVLAIRKFSAGRYFTMDDETTEKMTIWMREVKSGTFDFSDTNQIKAYYSRCGSAWPDSGCGGEFKNGTVVVRKVLDGRIRLHIKSKLECLDRGSTARVIDFDQEDVFVKMQFEKVTPWIGKLSPNIYDETYRPSGFQPTD
jgi:hypothetical protein